MNKDYLFEVVAGTYEEFLLCYQLYKENGEYRLAQTVANHSHKASLRAVATNRNLLASGGADEMVQIYDLIERRERGILSHHSGTVTCLEFSPDGAYLMSGSEDGSLSLVKVGPWKVHKAWNKAHKGLGIIDFSIHPSGKLALSVGKDKMVRTWNLVTGRRAFTVSLGRRCGNLESVQWSPQGTYYVIPYGSKVDIYEMSTAAVAYVLEVPTKATTVTFIQDTVLVVGEASGDISGHSCTSGEELWRLKTGEDRIKSVARHHNYLVTATSQGKLSVYDTKKEPPELITSVDSKCRITCLTIGGSLSEIEKKIKKGKIREEVGSIPEKRKTSDDESTESQKKIKLDSAGQKWCVKVIN